ncbi:MAG: hypothetical protein V1708_02940 [Candidatus Micrarchaeota archaeon]
MGNYAHASEPATVAIARSVLSSQRTTGNGGFCPICRTRGCAHQEKLETEIRLAQGLHFKRDVFGPSPPNIFVGSYGYPQVDAGPLVSIDSGWNAGALDDPRGWYGSTLQDIIMFRSMLARGKKRTGVKSTEREVDLMKEIVLSKKTVDLEVRFASEPRFSMTFSPVSQPMGPSAKYESMRIAGNPVIPKKVDSIIEEGLAARSAAGELLERGFDYYYLQKLLSAGMLGEKPKRKLVPTRWGITAADRMIGDIHIGRLKAMRQLEEVRIHSNEYLFNRFEIMLVPGAWEFEQFESWQKGTAWHGGAQEWGLAAEYEPHEGRSDYAETEGGGYYAGRFGVAEGLAVKTKRQAKAIVFREIGSEYTLPVGVWEVRENVRHAFDNEPKKFASVEEAKRYLRTKLKNPLDNYLKRSQILPQRRLTEF